MAPREHESLSQYEKEVEQNQQFASVVLETSLSQAEQQQQKYHQFEQAYLEQLAPNMPEQEILASFIQSALKVEFGLDFLTDQGYQNLEQVVMGAVEQAASVRSEILTYSSRLLKNRLGLENKPVQ